MVAMVAVKQRVRALGLGGMKLTAAAMDRIRPPARGIVFLAYHSVGSNSGLELDVAASTFSLQMARLAEQGRVVSIDAALTALESAEQGDATPVVITFDDGTADFAEHAVPILERYGIPATIYVATAFIEKQEPFAYGTPPLSWNALRDACSTGLVTVGSHTHTHRVLDRVDRATIDDELTRSQELIAERLGTRPSHFAYPKGVARSSDARAAVRCHFRSAALGVVGPNPYGSTDPYALRRSPVQASDGLEWFSRKIDGGMAFEGTIRESFNRFRYAGSRH
jgi:peptidoglycan/xylan/chitin deacetylase (PgdA/CDA1 family)